MRTDKILLGALVTVSLSTTAYLALQKQTAVYEITLLPALLFLAGFCSYFLFQGHKPLFKSEWLLWSAVILASVALVVILIFQARTQVVVETDSTYVVGGLIVSSLVLGIASYLFFQTFPLS